MIDYEGKKIKIMVEHEVMDEKEGSCLGSGDFWGTYYCKYHVFRDRTHGKKKPTERHMPKCTLFDEWLPGEYKKCKQCIKAVEETKERTRRSKLEIDIKSGKGLKPLNNKSGDYQTMIDIKSGKGLKPLNN